MASKNDCKHTVTRGRDGENGSWCVDCGAKVYQEHDRPCSECKHFKDMGPFQIPICRKHLMGVGREMRVTYSLLPDPDRGRSGLCFEAATADAL